MLFIEQHGEILLSQFRSTITAYYAWAITNPAAIDKICKYSPITEIGAGGGYWAYRIHQNGGDIQALDAKITIDERTDIPEFAREKFKGISWESQYKRFWMPIEKCSPEATAPEDRILMLCFPNNGTLMAYKCLKNYAGDTVIYIGEGLDGNCAEFLFHETLHTQWRRIDTVEIPQYPGIHDSLHVYKRNCPLKLTRQRRRKRDRRMKKLRSS